MKPIIILCAAVVLAVTAGAQKPQNAIKPNDNTDAVFVYDTDPQVTWTVPAVADVSVSRIDLVDASVKQALDSLFKQAKLTYEFVDKDEPDARITLKADRVKFATALDLITNSAGLRWAVVSKDGKTTYKVGKSVRSDSSFFTTLKMPNGNLFRRNNVAKLSTPTRIAQGTSSFFPRADSGIVYNVAPSLDGKKLNLDSSVLLAKPEKGIVNLLVSPDTSGWLTLNQQEERSTFICPHCKGQTTVVRHHQQPKCPKCNRVFQDEWQFCPIDGAKRPPFPGAWRFCPMCGKEVAPDKQSGVPENPLFRPDQPYVEWQAPNVTFKQNLPPNYLAFAPATGIPHRPAENTAPAKP